MKTKPIKRRKRLEGKITLAAQSNTDMALQLAQYGRDASPVAYTVGEYLKFIQPIPRGIDPSHVAPCDEQTAVFMHHAYQRRAAALCELFVDTLRRGDKKGHRDIERAIQNFRPRARDPLRHLMLTLKDAQHIAAVGGGETLVLSVKQILRIVYPRHEYPGTDARYDVMLASHEKTVRRLAAQMGVRLPPPGAPRKRLDK